MQIGIIGYGRMGHAIESVAKSRGHEIAGIIDQPDQPMPSCDVAIEFSIPDSAPTNILMCARHHIPVVSGTTGWMSRWAEIAKEIEEMGGGLFYASNFSIGVHLLRKAVTYLSRHIEHLPEYGEVSIEETHHIHKLDYPSGTAHTIAEDILGELTRKQQIASYLSPAPTPSVSDDTLLIHSIRKGEVPGVHQVRFGSAHDIIRLEHEAYDRIALAEGAVRAAEYMDTHRQGIYGMDDLISL